ncbi:M20 family metallo-hydrolase [Arsenicicoccus piscis]|uniref:Zn-dependent hydrolase n=1 Tax=Arsenicicoccus piscis TaxID=673954 RepID=A0ABQ6HS79_9MICO|nr:M20 family metallo-hydrolase [Arsenicicoccus piscis]GMA21166.1 Zn-dependent hydrolase [Arsenicicoccus piscis]
MTTVTGRPDGDSLLPDAERLAADLADLSTFSESGEPGWTRQIFSDPYRASRGWVADRMRAAGLETHVDPAGNVVGRLPGRDRSKPVLMTGSHTDTVHGGGRFDGIVGVLSAIEVARRLRETGATLESDLVVVDFLGEEANTFGISCVGSRAVAGLLTPEHLDRVDDSGRRLGDVMTAFGLDPQGALDQAWAPGSVHGYVELHVEQGPLLERSGHRIGVVTAIAGIERLLVQFTGRADHAGTMPMTGRHDALVAAAQAVLTVEREGCGAPVHGVSTTGRIESSPGALNVVPDKARIWAELRSIDAPWLSGAKRRVVEQIAADAEARGVSTLIEWLNDQDPVACARSMQDRIGAAADSLGYAWEAVPSGAGHDAAHLAHLGPMGMIFLPSVGGRSHVPEELSEPADIAAGAHVLAHTLVRLDRDTA